MTTIHFSKNPDLVSRALLLVERHEGYKQFPCRDAEGCLSIGFGTDLTQRGISRNEASALALRDICEAIDELGTQPWWPDLAPARQAALIDLAYCVGLHGLVEFELMFAFLGLKEWGSAATEIVESKWGRTSPTRASDLNFMMTTGRFLEVDEHV